DRWADRRTVRLEDALVDPSVITWRPKPPRLDVFTRGRRRWPDGREARRLASDRRAEADRARLAAVLSADRIVARPTVRLSAELAGSGARTFVEVNHYSATYPAARLRFGLYDGPFLVGVAVLGVPMQPRVLTMVFPDLEPYTESLELSRFVLADSVPANGES